MGEEASTLIVGPSKVGKTLLIASLQQACESQYFDNLGYRVHIQPLNEAMHKLLLRSKDLLLGRPLPATMRVTDYAFRLQVTIEPKSSFTKMFGGLFRKTYAKDFLFMDIPGGLVAMLVDQGMGGRSSGMKMYGVKSKQVDEVDTVAMLEYKSRLVEKMRNCDSLIMCADAAEANSDADGGMSAGYGDWISGLFFEGRGSVLKRICLCMTKSDLWALQEGFMNEARGKVQALSPMDFALSMLGHQPFVHISNYLGNLGKGALFGACMTSTYGFLDGGVNQMLIEGVQNEEINLQLLNSWRPYQTLDPFLFLLTGQDISKSVEILPIQKLETRIASFVQSGGRPPNSSIVPK